MSNMGIRGSLKLVNFFLILLLAGCSAGGTGSDFQTPPVSDFSFAQTSGVQVAENVRKPIQLVWMSNGSPISGQSVTLSISQGELIDSTGNLGASVTVSTQGDGTVTVDALSSTVGTATVTATAKDPTSGAQMTTTLTLNFVGPPSKVTVQAPSPIPAHGTSLITAVVADANGNVLEGVPVKFSLPAVPAGGTLSSTAATTDKTGTAHSLFTADGTISSVTVQVDALVDAAPAATQSATIQVVLGSPPAPTLTFSGCPTGTPPTSIPSGSTITCTLSLSGSDGKAVPNTAVTVTANIGSVTPPTGSSSFTTGTDGTIQFVYTASSQSQTPVLGQEVLTASAQVNSANVSKTLNLTLTSVAFGFTQPAAGAQLVTNVRKTLIFEWTSGTNPASPVSNQSVTISTTQGQLIDVAGHVGSTLTVLTGPDGTVSVDTLSATVGAATVTATAKDSASGAQLTTTLALSFVGPPSTVTVQAASPIPANGTSLITAVVDDASSNALEGIAVSFSIPSGGTLSSASTTTDNSGIARSLFTPDGTSSSVTVQVSAPPVAPKTATIQVTLVGSPPPSATLTFSSCPASIPAGSAITCTLSLIGSDGKGVANTVINLTASIGSVATTTGGLGFTTGTDGTVQFVYTAASGSQPLQGQTVLTASTQVSSTNITQTFNLTLAPAEFGFTQPTSGSQQTINVRKTLVFKWTLNGQPVSSAPVAFSTNLGVFIDSSNSLSTSLTENTGTDGIATNFDILSTATGPIAITAHAADPVSAAALSATLQFNFVGPPSSFTINAPSPIPANGTSLISVVVVDTNGTQLSGIPVSFALAASTPGGTLSATSVNTNASGTASSIFTPDGSATSATVTVTVPSLSAQTATIQIGS